SKHLGFSNTLFALRALTPTVAKKTAKVKGSPPSERTEWMEGCTPKTKTRKGTPKDSKPYCEGKAPWLHLGLAHGLPPAGPECNLPALFIYA
uniref:Uncharacterized protein n=1 Tax=Oryctolagus cuniculus TaxID=9986 RepID=A0A5F9DPP4_RABIT